MNYRVCPLLTPTACLEVESRQARELTWLPYAVRFKLDACGLSMSLQQWQRLAITLRSDLVSAPLTSGPDGFRARATSLGALTAVRRQAKLAPPVDGSGQEDPAAAGAAEGTPFFRYVMHKLSTSKHEAA